MKSISLCMAGVLFLLSLSGCGKKGIQIVPPSEDNILAEWLKESGTSEAEDVSGLPERGTYLSLGTDECLVISRKEIEKKDTTDGEGTWSIFVYMCGTDLETESTSWDLMEMNASLTGDGCSFIVQTGGTEIWSDLAVSEDKIQCHLFKNGSRNLVAEKKLANMGDASTLADFLIWGLENYPAEHMGLIFWDHGSGRTNSSGLSLYYPLQSQGSMEAQILKNICISPYYMAFLDKMIYKTSADEKLNGYDSSVWLGEDTCYWTENTCDLSHWGPEYREAFKEEDSVISYEKVPWVDEDGTFRLTVSEDTLSYVDSVYCNLLMDDEEKIRDLGVDDYVEVDWGSHGLF